VLLLTILLCDVLRTVRRVLLRKFDVIDGASEVRFRKAATQNHTIYLQDKMMLVKAKR
jgi:hypothetical protein